MGAAPRRGVGVKALARVAAVWGRRGSECSAGAVRGLHGSDARAAPEVRVERRTT